MQKWCRSIIHSDAGAEELAGQFEDAGFDHKGAEKMYKWARAIISDNKKACDLVLEFSAKDIPDDYVIQQYAWARHIIHSNDGALEVVRKTYCHDFGPMPLWYTADMYKFARQKVGSNDAALELVFEWYGLVEFDGAPFMFWWELPSMKELTEDIPKFYDEIRKHTGSNDKALEEVKRVIKCGGRCDLKEFKDIYKAARKEAGNDADALEAALTELEGRDKASR